MAASEEDAAEGGNVRTAAVKGTVRPLADSISAVEAERASKQVREAIAQQERQLEELQRFSDENQSLSELVAELPDAVSHRIMVLLGENHYAERSARQTVEILDRRSEFLDQKIAAVEAQIADLEAESSFVTNTAEEAKAGLVEIREEYVGSGQPQLNQASTSRITAAAALSESNSVIQWGKGSNSEASTSNSEDASRHEDREHDLLMARLSELEVAEAAAGEDTEDSDGEGHDDNDGPFGANIHRREVSKSETDFGEEYDSEEVEEEDSQCGNPDDKDDFGEDAEDVEEEDSRALRHKLEQEQEQAPLQGRPLSRFAREASARKGALDPQRPQEKVTFQQGSPDEKKPPSVANHDINSGTLHNPEAIQGFNNLQKGLQEPRRGVYQKERHGDEDKRGGSSLSDHSRVPSLGQPAAAWLKVFTGIVTEHTSKDSATENKQEVEPEQSRPVSKFKRSLGKR